MRAGMNTPQQILVLGLAGAVLGIATSAVRSEGLAPWDAVRPTAATDQASCVAPSATAAVTVTEALDLHRSGRASFVDLRTADLFAQGHVAGAVHMPCRSDVRPVQVDLPTDRPVVVYGDDHDAEWAAEALRAKGFSDIRILGAGYTKWRAAQGPAESGACQGCTN